jgi:hypothetical protein
VAIVDADGDVVYYNMSYLKPWTKILTL